MTWIWTKAEEVVAILRACSKGKDVQRGSRVHAELVKGGLLGKSSSFGDALVCMYVKCGELAKAADLLEGLRVFSWNSVIGAYAQYGQAEEALNCFKCMQRDGPSPNAVTFICILKACGSIGAGDEGVYIHDEIARRGLLENNIVLGTALLDMYAKCGDLAKAQEVLEELPARNIVSWNALIGGYVQHCQGEKALDCFEFMQQEGLSPNAVTFACILKACGLVGRLDKGEQTHIEIDRQGLLQKDIVLGTALVDMYAKCGALVKAQQLLEELPARNVVSWTALIKGYTEKGLGEEALNCFEQMQREGVSPNSVTFVCILKACGIMGAVNKGVRIHNEIAKQGLLGRDIVLGNALLDMYVKCGALAKAQRVLEELPVRNVVSWTALIEGYAEQYQGEESLYCFKQMQCDGLSPNAVTFVCVLKACGSISAVDKGEKIHDEISRRGLLERDTMLGIALVDMYAKCGAFAKAGQVLEELHTQDVVPWNALIAGYAQQGQSQDVLSCFKQIQWKSLSPDAFTFSCVLNACSHLGLVEEGEIYFANMNTKYDAKPDLGHYTCMVDLYGRAGLLQKAVAVIQGTPCYDYGVVWHALLAACWKWRDVNVGRWAFEHAIQLDKSDDVAYVLMANIYVAAGMQEDQTDITRVEIKGGTYQNTVGRCVFGSLT